MAIDFKGKDVTHSIAVKFTPAYLPDAKKAYNLKTAHQQVLDVHGIASKAELYNAAVPAKVIEDGFNAAMELIYYLAADGYKIKTPLFTLGVKVPGEYDGSETRLPEGVYPAARLQVSPELQNFLRAKVTVEFDGKDRSEGIIVEAYDEASGLIDEVMTAGNFLTMRGSGLKAEGAEGNKELAGVYLESKDGGLVKVKLIAINEPKTLKIVVPDGLTTGDEYRVLIRTQSSAKHSGNTIKTMREVRSDFLTAARE